MTKTRTIKILVAAVLAMVIALSMFACKKDDGPKETHIFENRYINQRFYYSQGYPDDWRFTAGNDEYELAELKTYGNTEGYLCAKFFPVGLDGQPDPEVYNIAGKEYRVTMKGKEEIDLAWGGKLVFINSVVGGAIDTRFMPAILKGIQQCLEQGPLTGSYARDVRVVVYDGKMHPVDSNELSFMLAARNAFSMAFRQAGPKVLEPIYDVEVFVPGDRMGDVMSDLQNHRGMVVGMHAEAGYQKLQAKVPLAEMADYATTLSSLTQGAASFIMKFASYELVPADIQSKLIAAHEAEEAAEK